MKCLFHFWMITVIFLSVVSLSGCGSGGSSDVLSLYGSDNSVSASASQITSVGNMDLPGHPVRVGDWIQIQGSGFGASRQGNSSDGYVEFSNGTTACRAAQYDRWSDTLVVCQVPQGMPVKNIILKAQVNITVVRADSSADGAVSFSTDAGTTANPNPQPTPPSPSPSPSPTTITSPTPSPSPTSSSSPGQAGGSGGGAPAAETVNLAVGEATMTSVSDQYKTILGTTHDEAEAKVQLLDWINGNKASLNIVSAEFDAGDMNLILQSTEGYQIVLAFDDTLYPLAKSARRAASASTRRIVTTKDPLGGKESIIYNAVNSAEELESMQTLLSQAGFNITIKNGPISPLDFRQASSNSLILIMAHGFGGLNPGFDVEYRISNISSLPQSDIRALYEGLKAERLCIWGSISDPSSKLGVRARFLSESCGQFPDSILLLACCSQFSELQNNRYNDLLQIGVKSVFGWDGLLCRKDWKDYIVSRMTQGRTAGQTYDDCVANGFSSCATGAQLIILPNSSSPLCFSRINVTAKSIPSSAATVSVKVYDAATGDQITAVSPAELTFSAAAGSGYIERLPANKKVTIKGQAKDSSGTVLSMAESDITCDPGTNSVSITFNDRTSVIAFVSSRDGFYQIYTINPDGTNEKRISDLTAIDADPCISKDGSQIVFCSDVNSSGGLFNKVRRMEIDGSNRLLVYDTSGINAVNHPTWNPAVTRIAFNQTVHQKITTMKTDGTDWIQLRESGYTTPNASLSPDGTKIVFKGSISSNKGIYIMNSDGTGATRITTDEYDRDPSINPDNTKVVFHNYTDGQIYCVNNDGTSRVNLTNNTMTNTHPTWSPDGTQITFAAYGAGITGTDIFVMNADGSGQKRITTNNYEDVTPFWGKFPESKSRRHFSMKRSR
jgi:TolB protein